MQKTKRLLLFCLLSLLITASCRKKEWDAFYGRPDSLAQPMYQVLQAKGNFTNLLALIDKSGYRETMQTGAGYWTFFAPNDAAFEDYFKTNNISGISAIDSVTARALIQFMLVYNAFQKNQLDDYQATENNTGWTPSVAFRRRTAYYTGFYKDTSDIGPVVAIANNRNNTNGAATGNYVSSDYNNKYLTYFLDDYFTSANLSAADYNYFYPNSQYSGFNVAQAKVVTADIAAENGVIHEIDKVITPLQSIDEYLRTRPEYSSFRAILNRLFINNTVQFIYNEDATNRYRIISGSNNQVYVKVFSPLLAYAPNNENFLKIGDNDGQKDCWTMFAPNNAAVDAYVKNRLLKYYASLDDVPVQIIADFLNAHLFPTAVWPTRFGSTRNSFSEPARFDAYTDVFDRRILSNGFFYGTTKVEEPDVFSTVFSEAYLNPKYTFMTSMLTTAGLKLLTAKSNIPANIFMISDAAFAAAGFTYDVAKSQFSYKGSTNGIAERIDRLIRTCVFFGSGKTATDDLSGSDIVKSGDPDSEGDYIKFNNNKVVTAGLEDAGLAANVDSTKTASNGIVYYLNYLPLYSENGIGYHLGKLGTPTTSDFNYFWQLMKNSAAVFNATTNQIIGLTGFSTLFVPTNAAIIQAVKDGVLPGTVSTGAPNFNPSAAADVDKVRKFLQYHILSTHTAVPDGTTDPTLYETFLKNTAGIALKVRVTNNKNALSIIDDYGRTTNVIISRSNNLSNRCVIHLIDSYLKYNDQ